MMNITQLTKEEKEKLFSDLKAEQEAANQQKEQDREAFKALKDETVKEAFKKLQALSWEMVTLKATIFDMFEATIAMKDELYNSKSDRQSDSFTTTDSAITIKLGNRTYEGWDDTVEIGIEKVKNYLRTLAKDEESGNLVDTVMRLLSKNRKGQLKANKVLELKQLAAKSNNEEFKEAIKIIEDAYRPVPSCQFIEVRYKDKKGNEVSLPLSMSAIN
jgi:hypothetical protein